MVQAHRLCLPHTASSKAGDTALKSLYDVLSRDEASVVIWNGKVKGFAAGTCSLRAIEKKLPRNLPLITKFKLAVHHVAWPFHLLSRLKWEKMIPKQGAGYILTIGVVDRDTPESKGASAKLINGLEEFFKSKGMKESWVDTEAVNKRARRFYEKHSYIQIAENYFQVLIKKSLTF